jgi:hypothetical protein
MPKRVEKSLRAKAKKKFPNNKDRQDAYVYGTMRKTGRGPSGHNSAPEGEFLEKRRKLCGV